MLSQAPNFQTSSSKSSQQYVGHKEQLINVAREHGSAVKGGKNQQPREMHCMAGSRPMLERWQRETAREGPYDNIDAVVVKRRDTSSTGSAE